jgi:hypothetical protein
MSRKERLTRPESMLRLGIQEQPLISQLDIAPDRILERVQVETNYRATLQKRFGNINAEDFIRNAQRFTNLTAMIFRGTRAELRVNDIIPRGDIEHFMIHDRIAVDPTFTCAGRIIDAESISQTKFSQLMRENNNITYNLYPESAFERESANWSQMTWDKRDSKLLTFYGQGGLQDNQGNWHELKDVLHVWQMPGLIKLSGAKTGTVGINIQELKLGE